MRTYTTPVARQNMGSDMQSQHELRQAMLVHKMAGLMQLLVEKRRGKELTRE